jgi:hypothetical protein
MSYVTVDRLHRRRGDAPRLSVTEGGATTATVLLDMVISLDGLICRPGGADSGLHDWCFDPSEVSRPVVDELVGTTGAIVVGRGAFAAGDAGAARCASVRRACDPSPSGERGEHEADRHGHRQPHPVMARVDQVSGAVEGCVQQADRQQAA